MAQDAFVSIGRHDGIGGFWRQSLFDNDAGKGESLCCDIRAVTFSVYGETLIL